MSTIAVAVSGGVDSLYALLSLKEQGEHDLLAVHGLFLPRENSSQEGTTVPALQNICKYLNIPLHIIDMRDQFDSIVIEPFVQAYAMGKTPNPCVHCNAHIKFGLLMDAAQGLGAHMLATGHYALLHNGQGGAKNQRMSVLAKGIDNQKDQSYFLCMVPKERLERAVFPLALTHKKDIVEYVQKRGLKVPVSRESQEICFVPADAYRPFLELKAKEKNIPLGGEGPIFVQDATGLKQEVGRHGGLWQYTEGQRRGLGIAWKEPLYVYAKDMERNSLLLSEKHNARLQGCVAGKINWLISKEELPEECYVRVRYRQKEAAATVCVEEGQKLRIIFKEAQSSTAKGQIAALYNAEGGILAGGIIEEIF